MYTKSRVLLHLHISCSPFHFRYGHYNDTQTGDIANITNRLRLYRTFANYQTSQKRYPLAILPCANRVHTERNTRLHLHSTGLRDCQNLSKRSINVNRNDRPSHIMNFAIRRVFVAKLQRYDTLHHEIQRIRIFHTAIWLR